LVENVGEVVDVARGLELGNGLCIRSEAKEQDDEQIKFGPHAHRKLYRSGLKMTVARTGIGNNKIAICHAGA
jgi:hypothetical protein